MQYTFKKHQLLNITTDKLWTSMDDIYKVFNTCIEDGVMTHMLPNARKAFMATIGKKEPLCQLPTEGWDPNDTDNPDITFEVTAEDINAFWKAYGQLRNPLEGKEVIGITL